MAKQEAVRGVKPAKVRRGQARDKVMAAAEKLIIAHGVGGTSIRAINAAAGVSPGILHYHFGSMDNLVLALVNRHMEPLALARQQLMQERTNATTFTTRDIAEIIALPLARLAIEEGASGMSYVRLLARLYGDRDPMLDAANERLQNGAITDQLFTLFTQLYPEVDRAALALRMGLAGQVLLRGLEELHREPRSWAVRWGTPAMRDPWEHVRQVINFMTAGLAGGTT